MNKTINARSKLIISLIISTSIIIIALILSFNLSSDNLITNFSKRSLPPSINHIFGTDWLGRDMFTRTIKGLKLSLMVGFIGSFIGTAIAMILGVMAATMGKTIDAIILWLVDMFIGIPHLVFIILISFMVGGGIKGVILGVGLTHWPSLTRVIRTEVLSIKHSEYIELASNFGKSKTFIIKEHIIPHILPQIMVGFLLLFPHAVIHEAAITFLGFGLSVQTPSIGLILSEAVKHISIGDWWLALFPGLSLILVVKSFDSIAEQFRKLIDPNSANE
ncbi:MAG: ABC transporter permease [Tissierellia bacterium]|nr:ABC transporter permease [Tissierellia bacterium]